MIDDLALDVFYEAVSACFDAPIHRLLDLGCGSGLQLERLFRRCPDMNVTGIDLSDGLLAKLRAKYPDKKLRLICGSYFSEDFGGPYDHALSTYSLHHFSEECKLALFKRLYAALEPDGVFVYGDYMAPTMERQQELMAANDAKRREQGIPDGEYYHFDTPLTAETERRLLREAGFRTAEIVREWENTGIIIAKR